MIARTCPLRTLSLKSTSISLICPDIWEPTSIVTRASNWPEADTELVMSP
jgi:hypothetical protein